MGKKNFYSVKLLSLAGIMLLGYSCSHTYQRDYLNPNPQLNAIRCVAIMPFENLTNHNTAGKIISDLLATEFYLSRKFNVMERTEVQRILEQRNIKLPQQVDPALAQRLGQFLGVEGIIIGSVSEYRDRESPYEFDVEEPTVGFNARLVSVASGAVLWASSYGRTSQRNPLNLTAQTVVQNMTSSLFQQVPERTIDLDEVCGKKRETIALNEPTPPPPKPKRVLTKKPARPSPKPAPARKVFHRKEQKEFLAKLEEGNRFPLAGVKFAANTAVLTEKSKKILNYFGDVLREYPEVKIRIEGHTDSTGLPEEDLRLSLNRAESVKNYLVRKFNIAADNFPVSGFGGDKPIVPNINWRNREKNRRVEFFILVGLPK
jgi:outer membrane protein OmpA-like peptidoglycan-associated protein